MIIPPCHGGIDPGAVGPTGLKESFVAWKVSCILADVLSRYGIEIIFTRTEGVKVALDKRVDIANKSKADYFISIHINSATNPNATGTETYAYKKGVVGDDLAHLIQRNLVKEIELTDRGVKYNSLQVVRETTMPAALVEVAFINNPREEALLKNDEFIKKAAIGIAKGVLMYLGIDYILKEEKSMNSSTSNWAIEAMKWATSKDVNLTDGSNPKDAITLERMVTILYRYDKFKK